jgi:hypothetical protein
MTRATSAAEALAIRMYRQGLAPRPAYLARASRAGPGDGVAQAALAAGGIQAQDLAASQLAVRARSGGLSLADVVAACDHPPAVVRTWLMRGTLHMVAANDARWLIALLGPGLARGGRRRREQLGLTEQLCARAVAVLRDLVGTTPLTRAEVMRGLAEHRVVIDTSGQAPAHLLAYAAASGLICRGPEQGREATYVRLDSWAPVGGPTGDAAAAELARRYLVAFGPAGVDDFTTWSGLPAGVARSAVAALGEEATPVTVDGRDAWLTGEPVTAPTGSWRLLPAFDSYLLGYRDRGLALDPAYSRRVNAGGGWVHPAVIRDGRVVGTWRLRQTTAVIELFESPGKATEAALRAEVADLGRFLGTEVALSLAT